MLLFNTVTILIILCINTIILTKDEGEHLEIQNIVGWLQLATIFLLIICAVMNYEKYMKMF